MALLQTLKKENNVSFIVISSILTTLFLAFIDEGYYSFAWMLDLGSWIVFVIYTLVFIYIQYFLRFLFPRTMSPLRRDIIIASIGLPLALVLLFALFS